MSSRPPYRPLRPRPPAVSSLSAQAARPEDARTTPPPPEHPLVASQAQTRDPAPATSPSAGGDPILPPDAETSLLLPPDGLKGRQETPEPEPPESRTPAVVQARVCY